MSFNLLLGVIASLGNVLIWVFSGNILMLSEGRAGVDNMYSLKEGTVTIYLMPVCTVSDDVGI